MHGQADVTRPRKQGAEPARADDPGPQALAEPIMLVVPTAEGKFPGPRLIRRPPAGVPLSSMSVYMRMT